MSPSSRSGSARPASPRSMDRRSYRPQLDAGAGSLKIEQIFEKRAAFAFPALFLTPVGAIVVTVPIALIPQRCRRGSIALIGVGGLCRPLEHLVQLAAVQPDAPALRAIVDFDPLALGDAEFTSINGTVHASLSSFPTRKCVQFVSFRPHCSVTFKPRTIAEEANSLVFRDDARITPNLTLVGQPHVERTKVKNPTSQPAASSTSITRAGSKMRSLALAGS